MNPGESRSMFWHSITRRAMLEGKGDEKGNNLQDLGRVREYVRDGHK